jgi:hypothetical protein
MFGSLDFLYMPSRDVAADVRAYVDGLGATLVFAIERFGTRVAMLTMTASPPAVLLAEHLEGDRPVLVFRVPDLDQAVAELAERGVDVLVRFEIPHDPGVELALSGPQRIALYQLTRPEVAASLAGRRDF